MLPVYPFFLTYFAFFFNQLTIFVLLISKLYTWIFYSFVTLDILILNI
jgi:hypothetical protein